MFEQTKIAASRRSLWNRVRLQLGGGLALSVAAPFILRYFLEPDAAATSSLINSLFGTLVAVLLGYYSFRRISNYPGVRFARQVTYSFAITFGLALVVFFLLRLDYSRFHFVASFGICIAWFYLVYSQLRRQRRLRFGVIPFGDAERLMSIDGVEWLRFDDLQVRPTLLDGVAVDLRAEIPDDWERCITDLALEGLLVVHAKQLEESLTGRVQIEHLSENNLGSLIPGIVYAKIKRVADLVVCSLVLPILVAIFPIVALILKLDSAGPVIFKQQRIGYRGKSFTMYKLRTMTLESSSVADARERAITRDNDQRITGFGRLLRRYRIDELPQIFNILKGDMSWIGPRPEAVELSKWYEGELPFYRYRHIVRPGITGWAQVKLGHVSEVEDVLEKLNYDFFYIRNFSFWLDILIVATTFRTVFSGLGVR